MRHTHGSYRVDQLEATAGDTLPEGVQPDPAWLAARRRAMRIHVSLYPAVSSRHVFTWQTCVPLTAVITTAAAVKAYYLHCISSWVCRVALTLGKQHIHCSIYSMQNVQGRSVVADLPVLGTALPIVVTQPSHAERQGKGPLQLPSVGEWVKLRNVKAWVVAGQLQVTPVASIVVLHFTCVMKLCVLMCVAHIRVAQFFCSGYLAYSLVCYVS